MNPPKITPDVITDTKVALTERQYLGIGYLHHFRNDTTGELKFVQCTEQEYLRLGEPGGSKYNPVLAGHTWLCSEGGTALVDTPDGVLGENEYVVVNGEAIVRVPGEELSDQFKKVPQIAIVADKVDTKLWQ